MSGGRFVVAACLVSLCGLPACGGKEGGGVEVVNSDPTAVITGPEDGSSVVEGEDVTLRGLVGDPDGGMTGLDVVWTVDGRVACTDPAEESGVVVCDTTFAMGEGVVMLEVSDPEGAVASAQLTLVVEAGGAAPVIETVALSPADPRTDDIVAATVTASAPDADALTVHYEWLVDGVSVQDGSAAELDGTEAFDKGQSIEVVVTVSDGTLDVADTSDAVTVQNTPPGSPALQVSPALAPAGQDLVCSVTAPAADPDGDELTYTMRWTVDGVDHTGAVETTTWTDDTVPGSETDALQTWTCFAIPDDGEAEGDVGSASASTCAPGSADCPAESCLDILTADAAATSGTWFVDPDGSGRLEVYCDMASGGWTLLSIGGARCKGSPVSEVSAVDAGDACAHLPDATVRRLAGVATEVALRGGASTTAFGTSARSSSSAAIVALQNGSSWHDTEATFDAWSWPAPRTGEAMGGWPNMWHSSDWASGVHWFFDNGANPVAGGQCRTTSCPDAVTTTWIR